MYPIMHSHLCKSILMHLQLRQKNDQKMDIVFLPKLILVVFGHQLRIFDKNMLKHGSFTYLST